MRQQTPLSRQAGFATARPGPVAGRRARSLLDVLAFWVM
jgi:hypothetical protein